MATVDNVIQYYEAILRREPTDSQKALWVAQLDSAGGSAAAYEDFAASLLLQATEVRSIIRLYQAIFDRVPDGLEANDDTGGGLTYWTNVFRDFRADHPELSYKDALIYSIQDWLNSDEYTTLYGSNLSDEDFLSTLYVNILGRPPEQEGFDYWLGRLQDDDSPITREQLIIEFTESAEFKADVNDEANDLLHTAARIASNTAADDISYEVPGDNIYQGELANEAPTDIIHSTDVNENAAAGTKAGADPLVAVDQDGEESFTWSINDPSGNFAMNGANIVVAAGADLNYEDATSYVVTVTVTDKAGNSYSEDITIDINDLADQTDAIGAVVTPTAESAANGTAVATLTASEDGTTLAGVTFTLTDDAGGRFEVVGNQIRVKDTSLIDHETATSHTVTVESSDGFSRDVTISITDVADQADDLTLAGNTIDEDATAGVVVGTLDAVETDTGSIAGAGFSIVNDTSGGKFVIVGNQIQVAAGATFDHETDDTYQVTVKSDTSAYQETFTINIADINEAPTNLQPTIANVDEESAFGTVVANLSVDDQDDGDTHTYQILSSTAPGAFGIAGNQLVVNNGALLDFDAGVTSVDVEVEATDSGGLTTTRTITVSINDLIDETPTDILPDTADTAATDAPESTVALLSAVDADVNDNFTFTLDNDPTGGAFGIDGNKLVLKDPTLVDSQNLPGGTVQLTVTVTDGAGNTYTDTIDVTVDQTGQILAFSAANVEVVTGGEGDDLFTANAGLGENAPFPNLPGDGQTAQGGDIGLGNGGQDTFVLTKHENNMGDGDSVVTGVTLDSIEQLVLINRDDVNGLLLPDSPVVDTADLCIPCVDIPTLAPVFSEDLIFEASLAPDIDQVLMTQSLNSVVVQDLQAGFWQTGNTPVDPGPLWDLDDVTGDHFVLDSDPQALAAGADATLNVLLDEVLTNSLDIMENLAGNEPGGPRGEDGLGTINLMASGVPSVIGAINNGVGAGDPTGVATHTVNVSVDDLTGSKPSVLRAAAATPALGATAALTGVDLSLGIADGIGGGLVGLEHININQNGETGDVLLVVDAGIGIDGDGDGFSVDVRGGAGEETIFFEPGTLDAGSGARVDGGDGYDILGTDVSGINTANYQATNIEMLKIMEAAGNPAGPVPAFDYEIIDLGGFDGTLDHVLLADGVQGDLAIINIPNRNEAELDQAVLCDAVGEPGVWIDIQQKCWDPFNPALPNGVLPFDFDLYLAGYWNEDTRVDVNFAIGEPTSMATLTVDEIEVLRINVEDPDLTINSLVDVTGDLNTLILTDDGVPGNTLEILNPFAPASTTSNLSLVNGSAGVYNQRLFNITAPAMMFLPVFDNWTPDSFLANGQFNDGSYNFFTDVTGAPQNAVQVEEEGAIFNMGSGNDWVAGNQTSNGIAVGQPGGTGLGADSFEMNDGNDVAFGFGGQDAMEGGNGDDELQGGDGNDTIWGDNRDATGYGDDLLLGGAGNDLMDGGAGNDVMFGGTGRDFMVGGTGNDVLCGDDGSDCLHGGSGNDLLIGGGDDTGSPIDGLFPLTWQGDNLWAGTGIDFLFGDSTCEPQCFTVALFAEDDIIGINDYYGVDVDGDGLIDISYTSAAGGETIADIVADLEGQWVDNPNGIIVEVDQGNLLDLSDDTLIIKNWNASDAPQNVPGLAVLDGPEFDVVGTPADIDLTVGGVPGVDDVYSFTVAWNGGSRTYTYTVQDTDWTDSGDEDSFADTAPALTVIRDALLIGGGAGDPLPAGVTVTAGPGATISVNSAPSTVNEIGELTVTASATDGGRVDPVHTTVDAVTNGDATIEEGDMYRIDFNGDATYDYTFTVTAAEAGSQDALFDAMAADIAANSAFHVNQGGNFLVESLTTANVLRFATEDGTNPGIEFQAQNYPGDLASETVDVDGDTGLGGNGHPVGAYQVWTVVLAEDGAADSAGTDLTVTYTSQPGDTDNDVAAGLVAALQAAGVGSAGTYANYQIVYPGVDFGGNTSTFDIIGDTPAVDDVDLAVSVASGETPEGWTIDFDGLSEDEQLEVTIDTTGLGANAATAIQTFNVPWNGSVLQTLTDLGDAIGLYIASQFPANHPNGGDATTYSYYVDAANQDLIIAIDTEPTDVNHILTISGEDVTIIGPLGDGGTGTSAFNHADGAASGVEGNDAIQVLDPGAPDGAGNDDQDFKEAARNVATQDGTQSLVADTPNPDGADSEQRGNSISVTYDNEGQFTYQGADVFITQGVDMTAGGANWLAFEASGFDNDDLPNDFRGVLQDAGYTGIGFDGADAGVKNVTYVGDWDGGASQGGIDMLAFENVAGGTLGPSGSALNYAEFENIATTRDDADATAASLFEGAPALRYVAIARNDGVGEENFLRLYYNEAGTDKAPEAVFELVGYDSKTDITFTDIVGDTQCDLILAGAGVDNINDYFC